jgi:hypothetical protein
MLKVPLSHKVPLGQRRDRGDVGLAKLRDCFAKLYVTLPDLPPTHVTYVAAGHDCIYRSNYIRSWQQPHAATSVRQTFALSVS